MLAVRSPAAAQQRASHTHPIGAGGKRLCRVELWSLGLDVSPRPKLSGLALSSGHPGVPSWSRECPRLMSPPHPPLSVDQSSAWHGRAGELGAGLWLRGSSSGLSCCGMTWLCVVGGLFLLGVWVSEHLYFALIGGPASLSVPSPRLRRHDGIGQESRSSLNKMVHTTGRLLGELEVKCPGRGY